MNLNKTLDTFVSINNQSITFDNSSSTAKTQKTTSSKLVKSPSTKDSKTSRTSSAVSSKTSNATSSPTSKTSRTTLSTSSTQKRILTKKTKSTNILTVSTGVKWKSTSTSSPLTKPRISTQYPKNSKLESELSDLRSTISHYQIVVGVLAGIIALVIILIIVYCYINRKRKQKKFRRNYELDEPIIERHKPDLNQENTDWGRVVSASRSLPSQSSTDAEMENFNFMGTFNKSTVADVPRKRPGLDKLEYKYDYNEAGTENGVG